MNNTEIQSTLKDKRNASSREICLEIKHYKLFHKTSH